MNEEEFKKDFLEEINAARVASGLGITAEFVQKMADYLVQIDVLFDFNSVFFSETGHNNRKLRVDGYYYDSVSKEMNLVIAVLEQESNFRLVKTTAEQAFNKLLYFIDEVNEYNLVDSLEMSLPIYDLVEELYRNKENIKKYRFYIFTNGELSRTIEKLDQCNIDGIPVERNIWNIDRLYRNLNSGSGKVEIELDFTKYLKDGIPCLETGFTGSESYQSYLCVIPGNVLADIYDEYGNELLERNVRSFLSARGSVNKKIRETILKEPSMFFAYNNGIAATAIDLKIDHEGDKSYIVGAKDFQIINGGQTTASLSNTRFKDKSQLENIFVQMKLTQIGRMELDDSTELIRNISKSSNSQNKINEADFFATHPFHIRIEQISHRTFAPAINGAQYETKWYYERARGQFVQEQMKLSSAKKKQFLLTQPKNQVITKTDLAKFWNSWLEKPHIVSKGAQTNFLQFAVDIDKAWEKNDEQFNNRYFKKSVSLAILFKSLERIVPNQPWYAQGYRANTVSYTIALLHHLIRSQYPEEELDFDLIWSKQALPWYLEEILALMAKNVYEVLTSENRENANVTQWCKKEACWNEVKKIQFQLPHEIQRCLIPITEIKETEKEAVQFQKVSSEVEMQQKVLAYSSDQWRKVYSFLESKKLAHNGELRDLRIATKIPNLIPTSKQSKSILLLLDRAFSEGFKFN